MKRDSFLPRLLFIANLLLVLSLAFVFWKMTITLQGLTVNNGTGSKIFVVPLGQKANGELSQLSFMAMDFPGRSFKVSPGWSSRISIYKEEIEPSELVIFDAEGRAYSILLKSKRDREFIQVKNSNLTPLSEDSKSLQMALKPNFRFQIVGMWVYLFVISLFSLWLHFKTEKIRKNKKNTNS